MRQIYAVMSLFFAIRFDSIVDAAGAGAAAVVPCYSSIHCYTCFVAIISRPRKPDVYSARRSILIYIMDLHCQTTI